MDDKEGRPVTSGSTPLNPSPSGPAATPKSFTITSECLSLPAPRVTNPSRKGEPMGVNTLFEYSLDDVDRQRRHSRRLYGEARLAATVRNVKPI